MTDRIREAVHAFDELRRQVHSFVDEHADHIDVGDIAAVLRVIASDLEWKALHPIAAGRKTRRTMDVAMAKR